MYQQIVIIKVLHTILTLHFCTMRCKVYLYQLRKHPIMQYPVAWFIVIKKPMISTL